MFTTFFAASTEIHFYTNITGSVLKNHAIKSFLFPLSTKRCKVLYTIPVVDYELINVSQCQFESNFRVIFIHA